MKNKINIIFTVALIILATGIIFLCIKNISLKNELMNFKNSSLESTKNMEETINMENRYLTVNDNYLINIEKSSVNVYAVYYSLDDNTDKFTGYVDIDSGKLLGLHGEGV